MSSFSSGRSSLSGGGSAADVGGRFNSFEREDRSMGMREAKSHGRRETDRYGRRSSDDLRTDMRGSSGLGNNHRGGAASSSADLFGSRWST